MGFDNECILSIQSLPGEYFCPVCRTLIYPNEALQTQCTHLYCKPCLSYVVATTKACPYDGYLVTETDSKPLMESNKSLAETIGKVTVHCLYHKSGCQWQGTLSACITHGITCAYGNSPVVCNRCGTQIVHRQVQEHAQLCPGLQSQTQQTDGSQAQPSAATTQAVTQDPLQSAAAPASTLPSATTATAVTASAAATGGPPGATTANMAAVPPSFAAASAAAPQTPGAEQWYQQQQLQYSQYYQQQYPGYNPYMQQYQQYGQYQQVYQQYTQPQMQVASQNVAQGSAQPASYVQPQVQSFPSQPQYMTQSLPQNQPQTGHPQPQQHQVQPHLQAAAGQSQPQQPIQSAPQVPQLQPQSQVPLQLSGPQPQPAAHLPAATQVGSQQFAITSTQSTPLQVQPHVQAQPPQQQQIVSQQHAHLQALPPQQNLQPQMQLNSQVQHQHPQAQQQFYPQPQAYAQQTHHMQPQNASYPQQQMPHSAPLQHPVPVSHQQAPVPQHPAPMCPPLPGQQPAMLPPQGVQQATQQQQHIGHHTQRPPMHSSIPSQAPQQGLPPHLSVSSQAGQLYQQGAPSSQQQVHSHLSQPHGPPYTQQHIPGYGYTGHHVQTSAGKPTSHLVPPQQFQHQPGGPVNNLQASVMDQQPTMRRTSDNVGLTSQPPAAGQPTGQGSLAMESHASKSGKPENAKNAAASEKKNDGAEFAVMRATMSESLGDENMNREQSDFDSVRKDAVQIGVALDSADGLIRRDGITAWAVNSHGPGVHRGKDHKASDASNNRDKGESLQQASQQNAGALGSYVPAGMGPQHSFGPDRLLPQHMHPGHMPYNMQEQPNQMRPPKHSFSENIRPLMQQPYGSFHPGMAPRAFGENQIQMPMPQPGGIRPGDSMIRPPLAGPLPGRHDTIVPPFVPEHLGQPRPFGNSLEPDANASHYFYCRHADETSIHSGMLKSNGFGGGPLISGTHFHEEGFNASGEHLRSLEAYPGRHNINHKDIEDDLKQFPGAAHLDGQGLQRGPRSFERPLGRPGGIPDSLPGRHPFPNQKGPFPVGFHEDFSWKSDATAGCPDFLLHGAQFDHCIGDGMPNLRNPGPFVQGMSGGPGGSHKDQLGSGNLPGSIQHAFDGPDFPPTRFHPGHMHPDDPNLIVDYPRHGFPKEPAHFGLGGLLRNGDIGWCRICMLNCGSAENLDLHVQTREHQQFAMDIVLKMKQDVANRQKPIYGGSKSFHNKKVAGKGHSHGNRR